MDSIEVRNIRCYGYTGYLQEEQTLGQWFEVDLILSLDLTKAAQSDSIADTIDYRGIIQGIKQRVSTAKYALVERLIEMIAQDVLQLPLIRQVTVKLTKVSPPIPDFGGQIVLEITRLSAIS